MNREELHNLYKEKLKTMLFTFYVDSFDYFSNISTDTISCDEINDYIEDWVDGHIKPDNTLKKE